MADLAQVSRTSLLALADCLASGRLEPPFELVALRRHVAAHECAEVATFLQRLAACGFNGPQVGMLVRAIAEERAAAQAIGDRVRLVWTGPEIVSAASRDTAVVMRELFESAERTVLLSGFAVHRGRVVLASAAQRMAERPTLKVRLFLNVHRPYGNSASEAELLREFGTKFSRQHWPPGALPDVYYDPRSLLTGRHVRASMHAKCVVVDDRIAFVTSANLTPAAQERNIEAGVLIEDETFARSLRGQFDALVQTGALKRLPL